MEVVNVKIELNILLIMIIISEMSEIKFCLYLCTTNEFVKGLYQNASKKLLSDNYRANKHKDSGFDLYVPEDVTIKPGDIKLIDMEVKCAAYRHTSYFPGVPDIVTYAAPSPYYLYARSSVSKRGIMLVNSVGVIDSGYRGNLMAAFYNTKKEAVTINAGDRIVQICLPNLSSIFVVECVDKLEETERGEGGLGSTGK